MKVWGFVKVRNEIIREDNLYRLLQQLDEFCDGGVICDDASTDGTWEVLNAWVKEKATQARPWVFLSIPATEHDFSKELHAKQRMMDLLHEQAQVLGAPDWILWLDGDEVLTSSARAFREWLEGPAQQGSCWAFHYRQLWRSEFYQRVDDQLDDGWYWKLWRYSPELRFKLDDRLHQWQFPVNFSAEIQKLAQRKAPHCEVLHYGNVGSNLVWKVLQYYPDPAAMKRHLHFTEKAQYRPYSQLPVLPGRDPHALAETTAPPQPFSAIEQERILHMAQKDGLFVVVVPTYNRAHRLEQTLRSVQAQTDTRWMCIVLDDGSTDDTATVVRGFLDTDPRFFYASYVQNRGGVAMNEIGCSLACELGEYWVRLGSDDYFEPHKLALDRLALTQVGVNACYGPYRDLHEQGPPRDLRNLPMDVRGALLSGGFAGSWANIAARTSVLRAVRARFGCFVPREIRNMEDLVLNSRIARLTDFVWRGAVKDGRVFVGGRSTAQLGVQEQDIVHDAVWRIAQDGASAGSKNDIIREDARISTETFKADHAIQAPVARTGERTSPSVFSMDIRPTVPIPPPTTPRLAIQPPAAVAVPVDPDFEKARKHWVIAQGFPPDKEAVYPTHAAAHCFDAQGKAGRVLEYGCGGGSDTVSLARRGAEVWFADIVPGNVEMTARRLSDLGLDGQAHPLLLVQSDHLPVEDGFFDAINCHGVLHHIRDPAPVLREMRRVLNDDGFAYIMLYTEVLEAKLHDHISGLSHRHNIERGVAFGWLTDQTGCPWAASYTEAQAEQLFARCGFAMLSSTEYNDRDFRTYVIGKDIGT